MTGTQGARGGVGGGGEYGGGRGGSGGGLGGGLGGGGGGGIDGDSSTHAHSSTTGTNTTPQTDREVPPLNVDDCVAAHGPRWAFVLPHVS